MSTTSGPVEISVPRDRESSFEPKTVPKHSRRIGQIEDLVLSVYARGMTTRDIQDHLKEIYDIDVSLALVSNITDVLAEEITT